MATFSICMWNEQLSLQLAREIKSRWPNCLIVFGGSQCPHDSKAYLAEHAFIDVAVRAEGEEAFYGICERFMDSRDFSGVPNVTFRHPVSGETIVNSEKSDFERDLDSYPSPYTSGMFDYMFAAHPETDFQAIIETNRGCPFLCTFCYWGRGGTTRRYRYHSLERVRDEIEWVARSGIRYLFNADSNFGMHKRDGEIVDMLIESKKQLQLSGKVPHLLGQEYRRQDFHAGGQAAQIRHGERHHAGAPEQFEAGAWPTSSAAISSSAPTPPCSAVSTISTFRSTPR